MGVVAILSVQERGTPERSGKVKLDTLRIYRLKVAELLERLENAKKVDALYSARRLLFDLDDTIALAEPASCKVTRDALLAIGGTVDPDDGDTVEFFSDDRTRKVQVTFITEEPSRLPGWHYQDQSTFEFVDIPASFAPKDMGEAQKVLLDSGVVLIVPMSGK